jgi:hypothetical protein
MQNKLLPETLLSPLPCAEGTTRSLHPREKITHIGISEIIVIILLFAT